MVNAILAPNQIERVQVIRRTSYVYTKPNEYTVTVVLFVAVHAVRIEEILLIEKKSLAV